MNLHASPGALLRRGAGLLYAAMHERRRSLVRPLDRPTVTSGGDDALRFLLIGNGLVHGWGVASHQLSPTGELARGIRTLTGRGCEVRFVGDATMSAATALDWAEGRLGAGFHGAVLALGSNDAMRLTPTAVWRARLVELLDEVRAALPEGAPVVVVGIPGVYVPGRVRPLNPIALRHARRLDRVTRELASHRSDVVLVEAPPLGGFVGRAADADLYAAFAVPIAVALAAAWRRTGVTAGPAPAPETFERADVAAIVDASRWQELPELAEIVERARARFGVTESAVTLLDGDRTFHVAANGAMPFAVPKRLSYCETVVASDAPLVVGDGRRDPRFADNAFLDLVHAPFYAGVPVHGEDGVPIGALCLVHGFARTAGSVDVAELRELAQEVERVLQAAARERIPADAEATGPGGRDAERVDAER